MKPFKKIVPMIIIAVAFMAADARASVVSAADGSRTVWSYAEEAARARTAPHLTARSVTKLHMRTENGEPEIYRFTASRRDTAGRDWVQVEIPRRPRTIKAWVPRSALSVEHIVHDRLVLNKRSLTATLYRSGSKVFTARIGTGKSSTPTPSGKFYIRQRLPGLGGIYGPVAFGTSAYQNRITDWPGGGVIGIHGTNQPGLIPGRPSNGCVRMRNADVQRLDGLLQLGTPVWITS